MSVSSSLRWSPAPTAASSASAPTPRSPAGSCADVLADWQGGRFGPRATAAARFVDALTRSPQSLTAEDVQQTRAAGIDDVALAEAVYVAFVFNTINRSPTRWASPSLRSRPPQRRRHPSPERLPRTQVPPAMRPSAGRSRAVEPGECARAGVGHEGAGGVGRGSAGLADQAELSGPGSSRTWPTCFLTVSRVITSSAATAAARRWALPRSARRSGSSRTWS